MNQRLITQIILSAAAIFFVTDVLLDVAGHILTHEVYHSGEIMHTLMELLAVLALLMAVQQMRKDHTALSNMVKMQSERLSSLSSEVEQRLQSLATEKRLTLSERDVMLLCVKGLSIEAIASARGVATPTVKVQLSSIYKKFDVGSRSELLSILLDEYKELNSPA